MDFNKIIEEEVFLLKSKEGDFNLSIKDKIGNVELNMKNLGEFSFYKWNCNFPKTTEVYGKVSVPSIRFYTLNQSKKDVRMGITGIDLTMQQGMFNVLFSGEEEEGYDIFEANDNTIFSGFFMSNESFLNLANTYPEVFEKITNRYTREKNFFLSNKNCFPITAEINTILQQLEQSHLMGNACETYAEIKILELFILQQQLIEQYSKPKIHCKTSSDINKIHEVRHILLNNIHNPLSLSELSHCVGLNENKLKYGFKEVFGTTVFGYLFDYKMQLAKQLLLDTNKSISEIAETCGYSYTSHFTTAFRRKYNISPIKFRK
ncbi:MAG: AraC family transcriptional regulator [Capnocytophaga sp.]|nr:AraC family transcriptional regulator [Capnocytophaga sp.]